MKVEITKDGGLVCPNCGSDYMHQRSVSVYFRASEDSELGKFIKCSSDSVHEISGANNPSRRRDGLLVQLDCEQCNADPELAILQHKGQTFMCWHSMRTPVKGDF